MPKIHCLNKISQVGLNTMPSDYTLTESLADADAILVRSHVMHELSLPSSVLSVARAGAGVNNIPLEVYGKQGIVCFNTPGANANAVKELTLAGMLLAARDIYGGMSWIKNNLEDTEIQKTVEKVKSQFGGTEILGKTIGIIGLGAIGIMLAKACHALGMKVYGTKRNLESLKHEGLPEDMILVKTKEEMLPHCDYISLNLPLSSDTKHMINKNTIEMMKDGVVILNFARDQLVHDGDLNEALQTRKVHKYVTDFPNHQSANMEHVIAIPHLGASTEEAEDNCAIMAIHQIDQFMKHGHIINSVNYPEVSLTSRTGEMRLMILYHGHHQMMDIILPMVTLFNVLQSTERRNEQFGVILIDFESKVSSSLIEDIQKIEGVTRIRSI